MKGKRMLTAKSRKWAAVMLVLAMVLQCVPALGDDYNVKKEIDGTKQVLNLQD